MEVHMKFRFILFLLVSIITFSFITDNIYIQSKDFVGTKKIEKNGIIAFETISAQNKGSIESLEDHLLGMNNSQGEQFVLGGSVLWFTQDPVAIANIVALNAAGSSALTGWGLNDMRVSLYSDASGNPVWNFPTGTYDPFVDISSDGSKIAATAGTHFYMLSPVDGSIDFQFALPDSFYASSVALSRDGSMAVVLAQAWGSSTTYRAYAFNLTSTPVIDWTLDVPVSEVANWAGVNFSPDGSVVAITGRNHLYILNSLSGSVIWHNFIDNTESAPAISENGKVVVTADNSGFVQTWHFDSGNNEYFLLWQYKVPPSAFSSWASSVGISAKWQHHSCWLSYFSCFR